MPPIEAREAPLGGQVLVVLGDDRAAAADATTRCRATWRACRSPAADALDRAAWSAERGGVQHREPSDVCHRNGCTPGIRRPIGSAIRRADDVEARRRAFRCSRAPTFQTWRMSFDRSAFHVCTQAERIVLVDAVVVGASRRRRGGKRIAEATADRRHGADAACWSTAKGGWPASCRAIDEYEPEL